MRAFQRQRGYVASWRYQYADESEAFVCARCEVDGKKTVKPWHSKDGVDVPELPCMEPGTRPLYKLPNLLQSECDTLYIAEGEKCAQALLHLGLNATTSSGGSGAPALTDWSPTTRYAKVVIIPDADQPGQKYADLVAGLVYALPGERTVSVAPLEALKDGQDVVDWVKTRKPDWDGYKPLNGVSDALRRELLDEVARVAAPVAKVEQLVKAEPRLIRTDLSDWLAVSKTPPKWIVDKWLLRGKVTALASSGGVGKSFLSLGIVLQLITGKHFWHGMSPCLIGSALLFDLENDGEDTMRRIAGFADMYRKDKDGNDIIRPDLLTEAMNERLHAINTRGAFVSNERGSKDYTPTKHFYAFEKYVAEHKPDLIVIDHLRRISGSADGNDSSVMGTVMELLCKVAREHDAALLVLAHANKSAAGQDVGPENFRGSSVVVDEARCAWIMCQAENHLQLHRVKTNHSARMKDGLAFNFVPTLEVKDMVCLARVGSLMKNPDTSGKAQKWIINTNEIIEEKGTGYAGGDAFDTRKNDASALQDNTPALHGCYEEDEILFDNEPPPRR